MATLSLFSLAFLLSGYKCVYNSLPYANKWGVGMAIRKDMLHNNIMAPKGSLEGRVLSVDIILEHSNKSTERVRVFSCYAPIVGCMMLSTIGAIIMQLVPLHSSEGN